jgi:hypothetical protein
VAGAWGFPASRAHDACDLAPGSKAGLQGGAVIRGGEKVPTGTKQVMRAAEERQELLGGADGLEALHPKPVSPPFSQAGRLVGLLRAIV